MIVSVSHCRVTSRTDKTSMFIHNDGRKTINGRCLPEIEESIETEFSDAKSSQDNSLRSVDSCRLDSVNTESKNNQNHCVRLEVKSQSKSACSRSERSLSYENSEIRSSPIALIGKKKYWFKCIAPKPFTFAPHSQLPSNTPSLRKQIDTGGADVCKENINLPSSIDKQRSLSQSSSSYVKSPLISDGTSVHNHIPDQITAERLECTKGKTVCVRSEVTTGIEETIKSLTSTISHNVTVTPNVKEVAQSLPDEYSEAGGRRTKLKRVTDESISKVSTQSTAFQKSAERNTRDRLPGVNLDAMGNIPLKRSDGEKNTKEDKESKHFVTTPSTNAGHKVDYKKSDLLSRTQRIPEVVVSDTSMEEGIQNLSLQTFDDTGSTEGDGKIECASDDVVKRENLDLRPSKSCDSAYSSDSRCTSMDSATYSTRTDDGYFADQDTPTVLSTPIVAQEWKSAGSSSSSSSSPLHTSVTVSASSPSTSDQTLRVISDYGLQRKLSSSSGSSYRSSLSFEESEDDMLSSDNELQRKAQSSWTKIRRMVIWSPFMQSFKKKYPWVQLAGHTGNFKPGDEGCILKKFCQREAECLSQLAGDQHLKPYAPDYHGIVDKDGERYTRMQDLLLAFDCPSVMDCKMGVRTYLEDELVKAKIKPRLRHDMYKKMTEISPDEPTQEEHEQKAVTKPRYMQWREHVSSSSNLGFRIEGIKKGDNDPSKDYKLTKTKEQVKSAFKYFIDDKMEVLEKYIKRLKEIRAAAEKSDFFMSHEVIGSSLLFVHDQTNHASSWMIDFGKTTKLPDDNRLTHRKQWIEGNREDGYLLGLDNLIEIFEEIATELEEKSTNKSDSEATVASKSDDSLQKKSNNSSVLSSQSSGESCEKSPVKISTTSKSDTPANETRTSLKPPLKRQIAESGLEEGAAANGVVISYSNESPDVEDSPSPETQIKS